MARECCHRKEARSVKNCQLPIANSQVQDSIALTSTGKGRSELANWNEKQLAIGNWKVEIFPSCNSVSTALVFRHVNDSLPRCVAKACQQPELCPLNQVRAGTAVRIK